MKLKHISWSDVDQILSTFQSDFSDLLMRVNPVGVYGEPRGGVIPAIMLSHRLGIPYLQEKPAGEHYLWVDDIADKGNVIARSIWSEPGIPLRFCLIRKKHCPYQVVNGLEVEGDLWIVFPWEDPAKAVQDFHDYNAKSL